MTWNNYYKITKNNPPSPLLVEALKYVKKGHALDLGSGAKRDTKFLKVKGFKVTSVDENIYPYHKFETFKFRKYTLINAQYSLHFVNPEYFPEFWNKISNSLLPNGIFVGNLFGKKDEWAKRKGMCFLTKREILKLIKPFKVLKLEEIKTLGQLANGTPKFWHIFTIILQKKG